MARSRSNATLRSLLFIISEECQFYSIGPKSDCSVQRLQARSVGSSYNTSKVCTEGKCYGEIFINIIIYIIFIIYIK